MDCHVANAPRNDGGVALLAMTWVALLAMTERSYDCNDGGRFACSGESHVTARQDAEAVQACLS